MSPSTGASTPSPHARERATPHAPEHAGEHGADAKVAALVAEFLEEKEKAQREAAPASPARSRRSVVVVCLAAVCAAAWLAPYPEPPTPPAPDPRVERASARVTLFLAARAVTYFRATHGRLPRTLAEAGVEDASVALFPGREGSFTLTRTTRRHSMAYDSSVPLRTILGNADEIIAQTGQ